MARPRKPKIEEKDLRGFKHFKLLLPVFDKIHDHACQRDKARNRKLHTQFELLKGAEVQMDLTIGNAGDREVLANKTETRRFYTGRVEKLRFFELAGVGRISER